MRSGRQDLPQDISSEAKNNLETEIKHWKVDKGLIKLYNYIHPDLQRISTMFKTAPQVETKKYRFSLDAWKLQIPLTIEKIIDNSQTNIEIGSSSIIFDQVKFSDNVSIGQFKVGTNILEGIGRRMWEDTQIHEG